MLVIISVLADAFDYEVIGIREAEHERRGGLRNCNDGRNRWMGSVHGIGEQEVRAGRVGI